MEEPQAPRRVLVIDRVPSFRRGLVAALRDAGFDAHEGPDPVQPPDRKDFPTLVVTVDAGRGEQDALEHVSGRCVVALLHDARPDSYAEALRAGARAAVTWEAAPELIVEVVAAALRGYALLPADVAALLAGRAAAVSALRVSDDELSWLCGLAGGATVGQLADSFGRSERAMHRLLHDLYDHMGVTTRSEAIVLAARAGLLDHERESPQIGPTGEPPEKT